MSEPPAQPIAQLTALIRRLEWEGFDEVNNEHGYCPLCGKHKAQGHADDCEIKQALEGHLT
jgi:hypothetical protein